MGRRTHAEAEVFVHLGGVGDQRVRHGDLVGRARHGEDEGFLGRRDGRAQVALADDLVDVPEVLGEGDGGVAQRVERGGRHVRGPCRVGVDGHVGGGGGRVVVDVLVDGWVFGEAFEK